MKIKNEKKKEKWILKAKDTKESREAYEKIAAILKIHPIVAKLLYNRGYTDVDSARAFIKMETEILSNPFDLKDITPGIERIKKAVLNKEKIVVFGDYDVDGVTSVCTLYMYLKSKGADIDYYIPNRSGEGYGVSVPAIDQLKALGVSLIITVDTGITANEEVDYAKTLGIDFVITDHHECRSELPTAVAVINPHRPDCPYPFKELAGVGVVFKLVSAYEEATTGASRREVAMKLFSQYADLVAIGTIADVMPIKSENRLIVSYGLKMIENRPRPGILALMDASAARGDSQRNDRKKKRTKITSGYIGYTLAPRINAAGRIRSAIIAVELFLSEDHDKAMKIADELCKANRERQAEENKIIEEAYLKIEKLDLDADPVIVLDADDWHHGVIGIVASRITEKYSRPTILVSFEGNEEGTSASEAVGKGSGRSIKGLNLVDALCYCSDLLVKFGGHELAAGLSVTRENLDPFRKKINEYARNILSDGDMTATVESDCEIEFQLLNMSLAQNLQILEPYGVGNPMPVFSMSGVTVNEIASVSDGKHTRFVLGNGEISVTGMYFSNSPSSTGVYVGDKIDVLFNIDINEYLGRRTVQLIIKNIRLSDGQDGRIEMEHDRFEEIWNGAPFTEDENVLPTRDDFAFFYRFIVNQIRSGNDEFAHRDLSFKLSRSMTSSSIGYIKLKIIIKVLQELNLVGIEELKEEHYRFYIKYSSSKTDLEKSNLLRRLRGQLKRF